MKATAAASLAALLISSAPAQTRLQPGADAAPAGNAAEPSAEADNGKAVETIRKALLKDGVLTEKVLANLFAEADRVDGVWQVEFHQDNSKIPGADPNVAPLWAIFRLNAAGTITWMERVSGEWQDWASFLKENKPEPRPEPKTDAEKAERFFVDFVQNDPVGEAAQRAELPRRYAAAVNYYGTKDAGHAAILKDKLAHISKWPERAYRVTGDVKIEVVEAGKLWKAEAPIAWILHDKSGKRHDGSGIQTLLLTKTADGLRIVSESSRKTG